jgi:uncharacterized protein
MTNARVPERPSPVITERTAAFWNGGATGDLRIQRCQACRLWLHPPKPLCPRCQSRNLDGEVVSGRGTIWSFTINRHKWISGLEPPYVLAEVELEEQAGLCLLTAIVECDEVKINMPVRVKFEKAGEAWVPVFAP